MSIPQNCVTKNIINIFFVTKVTIIYCYSNTSYIRDRCILKGLQYNT